MMMVMRMTMTMMTMMVMTMMKEMDCTAVLNCADLRVFSTKSEVESQPIFIINVVGSLYITQIILFE